MGCGWAVVGSQLRGHQAPPLHPASCAAYVASSKAHAEAAGARSSSEHDVSFGAFAGELANPLPHHGSYGGWAGPNHVRFFPARAQSAVLRRGKACSGARPGSSMRLFPGAARGTSEACPLRSPRGASCAVPRVEPGQRATRSFLPLPAKNGSAGKGKPGAGWFFRRKLYWLGLELRRKEGLSQHP